VKVRVDRVYSQGPHPKRKAVRFMRKDLVFRYLNSIETATRRMEAQLTHDSYKNLVTGQSSFSDLTDTELEFIIEHLNLSLLHIEELHTKMQKEKEDRVLTL
jgi:hypothetical protein